MTSYTYVGIHTGRDLWAKWRVSVRDLVLFVIVSLALVFAHRQALAAMITSWNVSPMYSYGFTVPLISGYVLWMRRGELQRLTPKPSWIPGGVLALVAILAAAAARAGGIQVLDQLAFLVSLTAGVLILFGSAYAKVGWAALAYLVLMIPIWDGFTESLHEPFQLRSAAIGVWLLQAAGIPAYREGTLIALPGLTLEVARACSGINYLVAVVALGLPMAYLYLPGVWRRVALLMSALLVAALSNGLRVALIGILAYFDVGSPLHGPFHILHGLLVAGIGYVVLFAGLRLLAPSTRATASTDADSTAQLPGRRDRRPISAGAALLLTLIFVLVGSNAFSRESQAVALRDDLSALPTRLGDWVSATSSTNTDRGTALLSGADSQLLRRYRHPDGAVVDLYIGYFASQVQGKEIVSAGAAELHSGATRIPLANGEGRTFFANYVKHARAAEALFWYELDGGAETNRHVVKARTVWDAMWRGRSNGAIVVLTTADGGSRSTGRAIHDLAPLVEQALAAQLPGRRRVGR